MLPKGKKLICTGCKAKKEILNKDEYRIKTEQKKEEEKLLIVDEEIRTLPTIRAKCSRCGHMEAEWWFLQTRKADEAETRFFRCTKCKLTWREYN